MSNAILIELLNLFLGSNSDKSAPHKVNNGTGYSFNVKGDGNIKVGGAVNSGYGSGDGNVSRSTLQNNHIGEYHGTDMSFNTEGGSIEIAGGINSGAFSGNRTS